MLNVRVNKTFLYFFIAVCCFCCNEKSIIEKELIEKPEVLTSSAEEITDSEAKISYSTSFSTKVKVSETGVTYSTTPNPLITNSPKAKGPLSPGNHSLKLTSLKANTRYFAVAYAVYEFGIVYGSPVEFTTEIKSTITVNTNSISEITFNSFSVNISASSTGNIIITDAGVLYSTSANGTPSKYSYGGVWPGSYTFKLTSQIKPGTTYYVQGYAEYSNGTKIAKGLQKQIKTLPGVEDISGNTYPIVQIGNQWWMAENLKTFKYQNGDDIPFVQNNSSWGSTNYGAYSISYFPTYGRYYNWYAVQDSRKLCPTGWHVPSLSEWNQLSDFLVNDQGSKLKSTSALWQSPNYASNSTGFSALPGGLRYVNGTFNPKGINAYFWTSTNFSNSGAYFKGLFHNDTNLGSGGDSFNYGMNVRCVKD